MTGGSVSRGATTLISRSRQISELDDKITNLEILSQKLDHQANDIAGKKKMAAAETADLMNQKIKLGLMAERLKTTQELSMQTSEEISALESELAAILSGQESAVALRDLLSDKKTELALAEAESKNLRAAISQAEEDRQYHMEATNRLHREAVRLEAKFEQMKAESLRLHNEVWESYSLTYQSAMSLFDPEYSETFLRREEKRLKAEIAELGTVNIGAIEAYSTLSERHDFLFSQHADIVQAEEQLQEVIRQLTEQMEQQFIVQFARISTNFNEVFAEMFGGGQASLAISDPDNVLESGIEITAQPPGKKLQSLSLLSGGERSLTAIALLFGILRLKPSPFCVLDEIESALDDANVKRFGGFLSAHSNSTQFVVITHRKGTMECANTLYGVTMQEMGVSKMVSVEMTAEGNVV